MLVDPRQIEPGSTIETDVCVIGAGPAGITVAREFIGMSTRVCLMEAGGFSHPAPEDLFIGEVGGKEYTSLERTRSTGFGGTSLQWDFDLADRGPGLQTRPLDPLDFEERAWVPGSGWPFGFDTLEPFYERASGVMGLGRGPEDESTPQWELFEPVVFRYGPSRLFTQIYQGELVAAENIDVYVGAAASHIEVRAGADQVERVDFRALGGEAFSVSARFTILAMGGIENARMLLLSDVGNESGLVGRFFMEHPHIRVGILVAEEGAEESIPHRGLLHQADSIFAWGLSPSSETLRAWRMPNFSIHLKPLDSTPRTRYLARRRSLTPGAQSAKRLLRALRQGSLPENPGAELAKAIRDPVGVGSAGYRAVRWAVGEAAEGMRTRLGVARNRPAVFAIDTMSEQIPNPESRVVLSDRLNQFGQRRARLVWNLAPMDHQTPSRILEVFDAEMGHLELGTVHDRTKGDRVLRELGYAPFEPEYHGAHHHMGTTRMHPDPEQGVVDANARVHSVRDLFIAGCSVFPTGGYANPTLTIVALALRLANHIAERLERDG